MNIPRPEFADDDGTASPELSQALADWADDPVTEPRLVSLLARSRLLVPVVAMVGDADVPDRPASAPRGEKSSDMAVLTLTVPGGRRALPVFTSIDALTRWRPDARPVPVAAGQAVRAAVQEGAGTLVVDLAGPVTYELQGPALRALAGGGEPARSPAVSEAVRGLLAAEAAVRTAWLVPGGDADGTLALSLASESIEDARVVVGRLARALAADEALRAHLMRGLRLAVLPPGSPVPGTPLFSR